MKLAVLFVQYDTEKYPSAFYYLNRYLSTLRDIEVFKVIIDNKIESDYYFRHSKDTIKVNGNNTEWEFSGWDEGLKRLQREGIEYDAVLFVNDSFLNLSITSLGKTINTKVISECIKNKSFSGGRGGSGEECYTIERYDVLTWVRTHCFLMEKSVIERLGSLTTFSKDFIDVYAQTLSQISRGNYFIPNNNVVCPLLEGKVLNWLYYGGTWHSAFKFEEKPELFRMKTLAYFNELALTQRAREKFIKVAMED